MSSDDDTRDGQPGTPDGDRALAAEYVLRLLDPAEETACAARVARESGFAEEVAWWQKQLSGLDSAFAPASPPRALRARIEAHLFGHAPSLMARLWRSAGLWRSIAAAAAIVAVIFAWLDRPVLVAEPPQLVATVSPAVGEVHLVALFDREAGLLRFTRLAGNAPPGRSLELWLLPEGETVPASLGVMPADSRFSVPLPAAFASEVGPGTLILVSDEVSGGSPTGQPQGSVLASGAISEL